MKQLMVLAVVCIGFGAFAQEIGTETPPPMVPAEGEARPPPTPPNEPGTNAPPASKVAPPTVAPGTPPPPAYTPNQPPSGYQYSPYGTPRTNEKPPVEWGLMVSETLFGALTAAGITILPYFLLGLNSVAYGDQSSGILSGTIGIVIFCLIFAATPLAVAQTEVSLANGSRYFTSDTWPAALTGIGTEGLILLIGWLARGPSAGGLQPLFNGTFVLIATIAAVPIVEMVIINLLKTPRFARNPTGFGALNYDPDRGLTLGMPMAGPIVGVTQYGTTYGVMMPMLSGRF